MKRAPCCFAAMLSSACLLLSAPCAFAQAFVPVTQSILANPDPADWLMINRTFDEQRFSPLDQINKTNVGQLRMAWSRGLPNGTQESTPIVYRGVMAQAVEVAAQQNASPPDFSLNRVGWVTTGEITGV